MVDDKDVSHDNMKSRFLEKGRCETILSTITVTPELPDYKLPLYCVHQCGTCLYFLGMMQ